MAINTILVYGTFVPGQRDGQLVQIPQAGAAIGQDTAAASLIQGSLFPQSYDVRATFNTTDATANEIAVSLTARGMTLPAAGSFRALIADVYCRLAASATDFGWIRVVAAAMGGATNPVIAAGGALNVDAEAGTLTTATAAFSINTTPTPDEVVLNVTGVAGTSINWEARIYIGPLVIIP